MRFVQEQSGQLSGLSRGRMTKRTQDQVRYDAGNININGSGCKTFYCWIEGRIGGVNAGLEPAKAYGKNLC